MICTGALVGLMIDIQPWVSDRKLGRQGPSELGAVSFAQMKPRKVGTSTSSCLHDGLGMTSGPIPFPQTSAGFLRSPTSLVSRSPHVQNRYIKDWSF